MKSSHGRILAAAVLLSAPGLAARGQTGAIQGAVKDLSGNPVAGATVSAFPSHRAGGAVSKAITDSEGRFLIRGLAPGAYVLSAIKESDDYPDVRFTFYDSKYAPPEVVVHPGQGEGQAVITVGPRAARVVGRVIDTTTGVGVRGAGLIFYAAEESELYLTASVGVSGEFSQLVGSNKPFRMKVIARGYEAWYYGADGTAAHVAPIKLSPGSTKELVIALQPSKSH